MSFLNLPYPLLSVILISYLKYSASVESLTSASSNLSSGVHPKIFGNETGYKLKNQASVVSTISPYHDETKTEDNDDKMFDESSQYRKKDEGKKGHKRAKFGEKAEHKKGHATKGFHNMFHKDEYHKEHKIYLDPINGGGAYSNIQVN
ncbi:uncharacterized protein [Leptinotarsa decemlineata]|uniref:uncharacterized protein n=1 Tax=Leptinotarsa decemlineata TaxID=7539 RepID=UPI003D30C0C5